MAQPSLIPMPNSVEWGSGVFSGAATIQFPEGRSAWEGVARSWQLELQKLGAGVPALNKKGGTPIRLVLDTTLGREAYRLDVQKRIVVVRAAAPSGAFYALQTFLQLFPKDFSAKNWKIPACNIQDSPRFSWRGLHLDVSRHFFPVEFIEHYIDVMARHKYNVFHWHLTDDQGWRIEIKGFPKLQEVAACRAETMIGHYGDTPRKFDGQAYCHFYSQDEIRRVVQYAADRFVTVVPEIEMPGHALAALSAYPDLGCTGGPYRTATIWGVFDDVFCPGNDSVFAFIDGVLQEVCSLFPGPYIHVGGDECPKTRWESCPKCQKRIQEEGLKDEHELQSYFIRRVESLLARRAKNLIGWDEILEGGDLPATAAVMSWRGTEGGIAAARSGHDAVMCPGSHCYFDHYQGDPAFEPLAIGGYTPLEKVYSYEPVPAELNAEEAQFILGAQGNVWTEYMDNPLKVQYMLWPRAATMAEVLWTLPGKKDWPNFTRRLTGHFYRLDNWQVAYANSLYYLNALLDSGRVALSCPAPDGSIRYTLDGAEPDDRSAIYTAPIYLAQSCTVKAYAHKGDKRGPLFTLAFRAHTAVNRPYTTSQKANHYTGGGEFALTDGRLGTLKGWGQWVGLFGYDLDPVIDLGNEKTISKASIRFLHEPGSWIRAPRRIRLEVSTDGKNFNELINRELDPDSLAGSSILPVELNFPASPAQWVKVFVENYGTIPSGEPGAGSKAWLFADEVIIE